MSDGNVSSVGVSGTKSGGSDTVVSAGAGGGGISGAAIVSVGVTTGSTVFFFVRHAGERIKSTSARLVRVICEIFFIAVLLPFSMIPVQYAEQRSEERRV